MVTRRFVGFLARTCRALAGKLLYFILPILACCPSAFAANITNGDVFVVFSSPNGNDYFAFVALTNIPSGTSIYFTDNGFTNATRRFSGTEGYVVWSHTATLTQGTLVVITTASATAGASCVAVSRRS